MVTDEERDLMYRAYAAEPVARVRHGIRRRLAPMLGNDRRRIELLYGLLFSLPGAPTIYYGDELGMGDNVYLPDRDAVRTPMQWSATANAGFSEANPQQLYLPPVTDPEFSYVAVNVAAQQANARSLLSWVRRLVGRRRRSRALAHGMLHFLPCSNRRVLTFVRRLEGERVLVVANLSGRVEHVELDLAPWRGSRPVELSGGNAFPAVSGRPYALTLSPHAFYWFALEADAGPAEAGAARRHRPAEAGRETPRLRVDGGWERLLEPPAEELSEALAGFLAGRRWFAGKARTLRGVRVTDAIPLGTDGSLVLADVAYADGEPETYLLPLGFVGNGQRGGRVRDAPPVAELEADGVAGVLHGAEGDPGFARALLRAMAEGRRLPGRSGQVTASVTRAFRGAGVESLEPSLLGAEQSNSSIRFGEAFIMKLFRKVEPGINPDLELGGFLTERAAFPHTPPVCGSLQYAPARGAASTLAILQGFVANEGDAWLYSLGLVGRFFQEVTGRGGGAAPGPPPARRGENARPAWTEEALRPSLLAASLLGRRSAELHRALASGTDDEAFAPEPFSRHDQRALYQSLRNMTEEAFALLRGRLHALPGSTRALGQRVLGLQPALLGRARRLLDRPMTALRTRTHGDYHLGQVLWTGQDFVIIDFEGEPARPAAIRRLKRSPLRDVAGLLRSYHYAAQQGLATLSAAVPESRTQHGEAWARLWYGRTTETFLKGYLESAHGAAFLPRSLEELTGLLAAYVLEKAIYELTYELNNRPAWVHLPLQGIAALVEGGK
jgi:maltose alpha-D-glucosyltransferase/alpha-amylase